ncbi:hypothetical protein DFH28DRAFT_887424, partial [Melampsora americana]
TVMVVLVAFWGMARLGELVPLSLTKQIRIKDVKQTDNGNKMRPAIRESKTSKPGQLKYLYLRRHRSLLDPVSAIERLMQRHVRDGYHEDNASFAYANDKESGIVLEKRGAMVQLGNSWSMDGWGGLTGHSFWVGGVLFLWN